MHEQEWLAEGFDGAQETWLYGGVDARLLMEATPGSIDLASTPFTSAARVQAALVDGTLVDMTSVLAPRGPVNVIAP